MVVSFFWGGGRNFFEKLQSVNKMGRYKTKIRLFMIILQMNLRRYCVKAKKSI